MHKILTMGLFFYMSFFQMWSQEKWGSIPSYTWVYDERTQSPSRLSPYLQNTPFVIHGEVEKGYQDGVLFSYGGEAQGVLVYLKQHRVHAAIRSDKALTTLSLQDEVGQNGFYFRLEMSPQKILTLEASGCEKENVQMSDFIAAKPGGTFELYTDRKPHIYKEGMTKTFRGKIKRVEAAVPEKKLSGEVYGSLKTPWAEKVDSNLPHSSYPRPQLVRGIANDQPAWVNLNGPWNYAIQPKGQSMPQQWQGKITVPFSVESQLSGVQKYVGYDNELWYQRLILLKKPTDQKVYLNFEAVDWQTTVWVNGIKVGFHQGGFVPFRVDITDALGTKNKHDVVVQVWDPSDKGSQPRGKQVSESAGIWYTPVTGIWQSVWLETVPTQHITRVEAVSDLNASTLTLKTGLKGGSSGLSVKAILKDHNGRAIKEAISSSTQNIDLNVPNARWWTPEDPYLYQLEIQLLQAGKTIDKVFSYAAMREVSLVKDELGYERIALNGEVIFNYGPLDQGWWPDGLMTHPTAEALFYDVDKTLEMGFNMIRKHIKVEPSIWYHYCDQKGVLVWQDMPTGFRHPTYQERIHDLDGREWTPSVDTALNWDREYREMIQHLRVFPSIIMWVPHNEGWGQFDTRRIAEMTEKLDSTRLVNPVSGWSDFGGGHIRDLHLYPGPGMEPAEHNPGRAVVLGEFGGLGLPIQENLWWSEKRNWGYRTYQTEDELLYHYRELMHNLKPLINQGLAAAVYTQTTDVEGEVNGLMTYDRKVIKINPQTLASLHKNLIHRDHRRSVDYLIKDSEVTPQTWNVRFGPMEKNQWISNASMAKNWKKLKLPLIQDPKGLVHHRSDIGFDRGTKVNAKQVRLVKTFDADPSKAHMAIKVLCAYEAKVYLNGELITTLPAQGQRHYRHENLDTHRQLLKSKKNVLAIEAKAVREISGFDLGLYQFDD